MENKGGSTNLPQRFPTYSHQKSQPLPSQSHSRRSSKSPQRKTTGLTFPETNASLKQCKDKSKPKYEFANPTSKVENPVPSFTPAVPVQQLVHFFDTILPKLKLSEFHRDPLE